jgi:hypothetical protein
MATRLGYVLLLGFLPLGPGCALFPRAERPARVQRMRPAVLAAPGPDMITLDIAIIERPVGDKFLNEELWHSVDDMVVNLEAKALLAANGYRFGQVVGLAPSDLQTLLKSERYCLNPRRRVLASGRTVTQILGPVLPQANFVVRDGRNGMPLTLDQARFCLEVAPSFTRDNRIRLAFTPKVETGERMLPFQPDVEHSTWTLRVDKPCRTFAQLTWEVTVEPNKLLVIGTLLDKEDTLGFGSFTQEAGPRVQRLLVLRASGAQRAAASDPAVDELMQSNSSPSLAQQAYTGK